MQHHLTQYLDSEFYFQIHVTLWHFQTSFTVFSSLSNYCNYWFLFCKDFLFCILHCLVWHLGHNSVCLSYTLVYTLLQTRTGQAFNCSHKHNHTDVATYLHALLTITNTKVCWPASWRPLRYTLVKRIQSFLVLPPCPFHPSSSLPTFCDVLQAWRYFAPNVIHLYFLRMFVYLTMPCQLQRLKNDVMDMNSDFRAYVTVYLKLLRLAMIQSRQSL